MASMHVKDANSIEQDFPYAIEITLGSTRGQDRLKVMDRFCRTLGFAVHRSDVWDGAVPYRFARWEEADVFRRQFASGRSEEPCGGGAGAYVDKAESGSSGDPRQSFGRPTGLQDSRKQAIGNK